MRDCADMTYKIFDENMYEILNYENFKLSGDILFKEKRCRVGLYLYRHSIELFLKGFLKQKGVNYEKNHKLENLLELNIIEYKKIDYFSESDLKFIEKVVKNYSELDTKGTFLRYSFSKDKNQEEKVNKIIHSEFVEKDRFDHYIFKSQKIVDEMKKLADLFYDISKYVLDEEYMKKYEEEEMERMMKEEVNNCSYY